MEAEHDKALTRALIRRALEEDVGPGDVTTLAMVPEWARAKAALVAREDGVVAGIDVAAAVFRELDRDMIVVVEAADGSRVKTGTVILRLQGRARALLTGERVALNVLQRLCGIATETARYVTRVEPHPVAVLDTRKTTPTLRHLEKYAVRCGGGENHRMGLYDRIMMKDNHLAFWQSTGHASLSGAVRTVRARYPDLLVEVEIDHRDQLVDVLVTPPDWVLLDNMTPDTVAACVSLCRGHCKVEVSGGITLETVSLYAAAGPDAISVGALTHSVRSMDIAMDWAVA